MRRLSPLCASILVFASLARGAPATNPVSPADEKRQQQIQSTLEVARLPTISVNSIADVLHLSMSNDVLVMRFLLHNLPQQNHVALPNAGIVATLQIFPVRGDVGGSPGMSQGMFMVLRDFSPPGSMSIWTTVSSANGRVQLSRDYESATISGSTELIQDSPRLPGDPAPREDPVRLTIRHTNELTQHNDIRLKFSAPTFAALVRDHPAETEQFLRPIFHDLGQESAVFAPDPAAVWQVLADDWKPDAALTTKVNDSVSKFDAKDFQTQKAAAHELHLIGEPAALTLMHEDRTHLSAAANSGVDTFLAPFLPLSTEDADRLGQDRQFLLDSQYLDDPALRTLAANRLAKVTGRPIGFDPLADDAHRIDQVRRLREADHPTTAP